MTTFFIHYAESVKIVVYILVFLGMIIEGDIVLYIALYSAHYGYLHYSVLVPIALIGVIFGDFLWYKFGYYLEQRFKFMKKFNKKIPDKLDKHLQTHPFSSIFISKFTYGFNHLILVHAGLKKISLKTYLKADLLAILVWFSLIFSIGFFAYSVFSLFEEYLEYVEIGLAISLIGFIFITYLISKFSSKKLEE